MPVDPNEPVYCTCRRVSFGNMIACENPDCLIEWYHFTCVNLTSEVTLFSLYAFVLFSFSFFFFFLSFFFSSNNNNNNTQYHQLTTSISNSQKIPGIVRSVFIWHPLRNNEKKYDHYHHHRLSILPQPPPSLILCLVGEIT
jgi:hypothetical protein